MRMIKGFVVVLIGLFLVVTVISFFIPSRINVTRAEPMHGDSLKIFNEIADLRNWKHWQPVFKDSSLTIQYSNITNQANSYAEWTTSGKKNKVVIKEIKYPFVKIALQREGENDIENMFSVLPVQEQGNMQVQWQSITKLKWYPWEKFGGIFVEKMTGPGYGIALKNLKNFIENGQ